MSRPSFRCPLSVVVCLTAAVVAIPSLALAQAAPAAPSCPSFGWSEGLGVYLKPAMGFPWQDTKNDTPTTPAPDCVFQQWSAEAFVWATAIGANGAPRFLGLPTPDQLLTAKTAPKPPAKITLRLAHRSVSHNALRGPEGAGAIVEADGNVMIAPNGYPVYASVHMNPSYFATARSNLVATGQYQKQPADSYFDPGAAVFKATWMRLDDKDVAPAGAYTTTAEVPVLDVFSLLRSYMVVPSDKTVTVKVALVGLHVVGFTANHPEFLWGTFEHHLNSPRVPDNKFCTSGTSSSGYTFYQANTSYLTVNLPNPPNPLSPTIPPNPSCTPPQPKPPTYPNPTMLAFNMGTQKFSPTNNVVLENQTGGSNFPTGPSDIAAVNAQMQSFLRGKGGAQATFANYDLIGTVWFAANSYQGTAALAMNQTNAVGSVNLANTTAETFEQYPTNTVTANVQNCFMCHNAQSPAQSLPSRRIAISHVLEVGTPYAVPNRLTIPRSSSK